MILATPLSLLTSTLTPTPADVAFHQWCEAWGVWVSPSVQLVTTPRSVGGRGVFAVGSEQEQQGEPLLRKDDVIAAIPNGLVFHPFNAAGCFPETYQTLQEKYRLAGLIMDEEDPKDDKNKRFGWINKLWNRLIWRQQQHQEYHQHDGITTPFSELWQLELTEYALAACAQDHPWADWIRQWQRDDPAHRLIRSVALHDDAQALEATAKDLNKLMMPSSSELSPLALQAALSIRLERFHRHQQIARRKSNDDDDEEVHSHDEDFANMYSLVGSRVAGLGDDISGVIPFHDMVNHSLDPNVCMSLHEDHVELYCTRDIQNGEEILLQYTKADEPMDETNAMWALVQWGIPTAASDIVMEK